MRVTIYKKGEPIEELNLCYGKDENMEAKVYLNDSSGTTRYYGYYARDITKKSNGKYMYLDVGNEIGILSSEWNIFLDVHNIIIESERRE